MRAEPAKAKLVIDDKDLESIDVYLPKALVDPSVAALNAVNPAWTANIVPK